MDDSLDENLGEKRSLYCSECEEEQTFVRTVWSGVEYYGSPPVQEYGWECSVCGSRVLDPNNGQNER
jgi:hypothetical protein